jgi:hypothetical protein
MEVKAAICFTLHYHCLSVWLPGNMKVETEDQQIQLAVQLRHSLYRQNILQTPRLLSGVYYTLLVQNDVIPRFY